MIEAEIIKVSKPMVEMWNQNCQKFVILYKKILRKILGPYLFRYKKDQTKKKTSVCYKYTTLSVQCQKFHHQR